MIAHIDGTSQVILGSIKKSAFGTTLSRSRVCVRIIVFCPPTCHRLGLGGSCSDVFLISRAVLKGHGSPRNSLANTRAPPRMWWARSLRPHVYLRDSATTCGLDLAHAPQLAYTHTLDCHCL